MYIKIYIFEHIHIQVVVFCAHTKTRGMTPSYVWHNSFIYCTCHIHIHSYVGHDAFICVIWLIHTWDVTQSYIWHDLFTCVPWLIHMCNMKHSDVEYDTFICATRLIHSWGTWLTHLRYQVVVFCTRIRRMPVRARLESCQDGYATCTFVTPNWGREEYVSLELQVKNVRGTWLIHIYARLETCHDDYVTSFFSHPSAAERSTSHSKCTSGVLLGRDCFICVHA